MEEGVTYYHLLKYDYDYNEYSLYEEKLSSITSLYTVINYCPYCGEELELLRNLHSKKRRYYVKEKRWKSKEFSRYWRLYRKGGSKSE